LRPNEAPGAAEITSSDVYAGNEREIINVWNWTRPPYGA